MDRGSKEDVDNHDTILLFYGCTGQTSRRGRMRGDLFEMRGPAFGRRAFTMIAGGYPLTLRYCSLGARAVLIFAVASLIGVADASAKNRKSRYNNNNDFDQMNRDASRRMQAEIARQQREQQEAQQRAMREAQEAQRQAQREAERQAQQEANRMSRQSQSDWGRFQDQGSRNNDRPQQNVRDNGWDRGQGNNNGQNGNAGQNGGGRNNPAVVQRPDKRDDGKDRDGPDNKQQAQSNDDNGNGNDNDIDRDLDTDDPALSDVERRVRVIERMRREVVRQAQKDQDDLRGRERARQEMLRRNVSADSPDGKKWDPLESTCRHASLSIL